MAVMNFVKELEWSPLHCMVEKGELESVQELLSQGADINAKDKYSRSPLSVAASNNNIDLVKLLVNDRANINDGFSLHYACEKGHNDTIKFLVENGALVNLERQNNYPLLITAAKGNLEGTKILAEHGADIHVMDENKETALHWACDSGNEDVISLLIDFGCPLDIENKYGFTPLTICLLRQENKPHLIKLLLKKGAKVDLCDDQGYTYLHTSEHPESTLELIKYGVDVNTQNIFKTTPLYNALLYKYVDCAKVLLKNKADPNIPAVGGWTPLHLAAAEGNLDLLEHLIEAGADINVTSAENIIPLHLAAQKGHLDIVRRLLEQGSFIDIPIINIRDISCDTLPHFVNSKCVKNGITPFSFAADNGHVEVCKLLISYGANFDSISNIPKGVLPSKQLGKKINDWPDSKLLTSVRSNNLEEFRTMEDNILLATDSLGWTPLHHSVEKGLFDMSYEIIKKSSSMVNVSDKYGRTPLSIAAAKNDLSILTLLLDNGAVVDLGLALHYAVDNESFECIKQLIRQNCDMNIGDNTVSRNTVLMKAASDSKKEIVKVLLDANANPNCTNKWGETPLHESCRLGDFGVTQVLVSKGAEVNAVDTLNETPLLNACMCGHCHLDIIKLLLRNNANANAKNNFKSTPLHKAVSSNCEGAVKELLRLGASVNDSNESEETPMFLVDNLTILKAVIKGDAHVNYSTSDGWTPLHECAVAGNFKCVKELLQNEANVNCASAEYVLPIYLASIKGHVAIVKELIDNGSYLDPYILNIGVIRDDSGVFPLSDRYHIVSGNTPLIGAASKGHLEVVKLLCMYGASLNAVNCKGNTALHEAVIGGFEAIIEFLLSLKVDQSIRNKDEKTVLDLIKEQSNEELTQFFSSKI